MNGERRVRSKMSSLAAKSVPEASMAKAGAKERFYPWLSYSKEGKKPICKVCHIALYNVSKIAQHELSSRHQKIMNQLKTRQAKLPKTSEVADKSESGTVENGKLENRPSSNPIPATKRKRNGGQSPIPDVQNAGGISAAALAKFEWLAKDDNNENRCHCRVCDTRLPFTSHHLEQHHLSRKHAARLKEATPSVSTDSKVVPMDADLSDFNTTEPPAKCSRRSMERGAAMGHDSSTAQAPEPMKLAPTQPPEPRHVMDLFFDSVAHTMKTLPADLAAEGKAKIMHLVWGLEVRAMHMNSAKAASLPSAPAPRTPVSGAPSLSASVQAPAAVITPNKDDQITQNSNIDRDSTRNNSESASLSNPNDLPENIRRILSSSQLQVTNRNNPDSVRCVPLHKLTTPSPISVNGNGRHGPWWAMGHGGACGRNEQWHYPGQAPANTREQQQ